MSKRQHGRRSRLLALVAGAALAASPATAFAVEAEGIAALGLNLPGLIAQLVNFTILLIVLRLFLWKPVMRVIDERKRRIEEGLQQSERAAEAAAASQVEAQRTIDEARAESRRLVEQAQQTAARLREDLEARARTDAEGIVTRAREEIRLERDQAIQQLQREFSDLTIRAAERVVGQALDRQAHQRLIDEVLVESRFSDGSN